MMGKYAGVDQTLEILDDRLQLAGMLSFLSNNGQAARTVPYATIASVSVVPRTAAAPGTLRVVLSGSTAGLFEQVHDEVRFRFTDLGAGATIATSNATMEGVRSFVEGKAREAAARGGGGGAGLADEILKLALLVEQGILTHAEFETAKRRLLGAG
jgi:hypothetical protein